MALCKRCGKEFAENGSIYCNACRWYMRWPDDLLNSPELATRRKRSHNLKMLSLDRNKGEAVFQSSSEGKTYTATLKECTCKDYALGHGGRPCKHILRIAEELELFRNEHFATYEYDYTFGSKTRSILPASLLYSDQELVDKYVDILRLIVRGRRICIKRWGKNLSALSESTPANAEESIKIDKRRENLSIKLKSYYSFNGGAREIKQYKYKSQ